MDIFQLEYALAVARYQHFTRAADEICVSQSALSHQICKLEDELGVQLFRRTTRAVYLTPAGERFVEHAARILADITRTKQMMRQYAVAECGEIIIGAIPTIGLLGLAAEIAAFQNSHPNLSLSIQEDFSARLLDMLLAFAVDVAIMTLPTNKETYSDINFYPLICDELVLTVPAAHRLADKPVIDLSDIKDEKFIVMKPGNGLRGIALEACHSAGFEPNIIYQSSQVETTLAFVAAGAGVALMTSKVARFLKNIPYKIVKINNAPKRVTVLACLQQNFPSPAAAAFCSFMRDRYHCR